MLYYLVYIFILLDFIFIFNYNNILKFKRDMYYLRARYVFKHRSSYIRGL